MSTPNAGNSESPHVYGATNSLTHCVHWSSPLDIIAIQHFCCRKFYACISCHDASETHASDVWPISKRGESAVLCGKCKHILTIEEYLKSGSVCTRCAGAFNPGCKNHWNLYFEVKDSER
ncbi:hypothetical protein PSPO01_12652 [Paraphaeosphaeria sporulosa]